MLNWGLIRSPINWVTITLMLLFAALAADLLASLFSTSDNGQS